jgi:hypothetical protein
MILLIEPLLEGNKENQRLVGDPGVYQGQAKDSCFNLMIKT